MTPGRLRQVRAVAVKDLRIEANSRVLTNQVAPFALIVMVMFAFALDAEGILRRVAPGLVWLATLFAMMVIVQRNFALERDDGALDAMRTAGVDTGAMYLGKALALAVQLMILEALLIVAAVVLYGVEIDLPGAAETAVTALCVALALGFAGTLYGGLAAGARGRETLLPLLLLPVVAPVLIGATRATEAAFRSGGTQVHEGWPWVGLVAVFAVLFGFVGSVAFGPLVDE
jgi:heme exporter protein B